MQKLLTAFADNVIHGSDRGLPGETIASVVITGLVVVFIGLILLVFFVQLYGTIFKNINLRKEAKQKAIQQDAEKSAQQVSQEAQVVPDLTVEDGIEEEVVAAIMGAISAMSAQSGKKLALKSIKTAKPQRNAWSMAGVVDNTRPF